MRAGPISAIVLVAALAATQARADEPAHVAAQAETTARDAMPTPIDRLAEDTVDAFTGTNLLFYGGAIVATGVMAYGGADQALRKWTQTDWRVRAYDDLSYYGGYIVPAIVAPALYVLGLAVHDRTLAGAGAAATQALGVTLVTTGILKVATGRPFPTHGGDPNDAARLAHGEYAREFDPFALGGQYAWPSGHTSSAFSVAAALTAYDPESMWVPLVAYPVALAIGVGMVAGDRHWASDVLAGALIGQAIGWSVGRDFRRFVREGKRSDARSSAVRGWQIRPLAGATYGLAVSGGL